jgi:hypothetical protein
VVIISDETRALGGHHFNAARKAVRQGGQEAAPVNGHGGLDDLYRETAPMKAMEAMMTCAGRPPL